MRGVNVCGKTDVGIKRKRNEDNYVVEPDYGLFAVADGMGGHSSGDQASSMAIETVGDFVKKAVSGSEIEWPFGVDRSLSTELNIISSGIRLANRRIFDEAKGMGTTMVVLLIRHDKAYICHVGDSRLYRIRNSAITQLTEDHSLVAEEIRRGSITREQARSYSLRHVITRAIGTTADIKCDCRVEDIISGDMFLLCSDGLTGMLEDSEILGIIEKDAGGDLLETRCERLIEKANEKGGDDNITAILVRYV
ncbi:MAG: Stp1/IreP family PP2C-type Ser/Thr phosphatase [Nitrospirae bacterium]|nr:Stp1/IreP family PP2C-type Ser/Thr phosphatase [Nitrospirota bacterium]